MSSDAPNDSSRVSDGEELEEEIDDAVRILQLLGPLTPARLAREMSCSQSAAFRLLSRAAISRKWGPYLFQRIRSAEQSPMTVQFLFHDPRAGSSDVLTAVRGLQEQVFRLEAKMDAALAKDELGPPDS